MPDLPVGTKVRDATLKTAVNGFIVEYSIFGKKDPNSPFSDENFLGRKEQIFSFAESAKAMETLVQLGKLSGEIPIDTETGAIESE